MARHFRVLVSDDELRSERPLRRMASHCLCPVDIAESARRNGYRVIADCPDIVVERMPSPSAAYRGVPLAVYRLVAHIKPSARGDEFSYPAPKEDEDGWSRWQLWSLMSTFGPHIWMTGEPCFATEIKFETK